MVCDYLNILTDSLQDRGHDHGGKKRAVTIADSRKCIITAVKAGQFIRVLLGKCFYLFVERPCHPFSQEQGYTYIIVQKLQGTIEEFR